MSCISQAVVIESAEDVWNSRVNVWEKRSRGEELSEEELGEE